MSEHGVIRLEGCSPVPIAGYLKALGVFRLVYSQLDEGAKGYWDGDTFCLCTRVTDEELIDFFAYDYAPSPIVAPWNGGSGFYATRHEFVEQIRESATARLDAYRETIVAVETILGRLGIGQKPKDEMKAQLLRLCRNELSDSAVEWLDAVALLTHDDPKFPPLLGTGGNDGNLEFTNNFMQNVLRLMNPADGRPTEHARFSLQAALFGTAVPNMVSAAIGQYSPGQAGGPNATNGFVGESIINPWDFVLMMEGTIVFAAAATRKNEATRRVILSYPFTVKPSGGGSGSTSLADEDGTAARAEMWMPIWRQPTLFTEVRHLFREGRVQLRNRRATGRKAYRVPENGVDFARACASLGVDRGIDEFVRYAFLMRSGKSYLAVPLTRFPVRRRPQIDLLHDLDAWLARVESYCSAKEAPQSFQSALYGIHCAMFEVAEFGGGHRVMELLLQLSRIEKLCVHSPDARAAISPLVLNNPLWLESVDPADVVAWDIALAIASLDDVQGQVPLRAYFSPIDPNRPSQWSAEASPPRVVYGTGDVSHCLARVLERRLLDWRQLERKRVLAGEAEGGADTAIKLPQSQIAERRRREKPFRSRFGVTLPHIQAFLWGGGELRRRVNDYLWALMPFTAHHFLQKQEFTLRTRGQRDLLVPQANPLPWAYEVSRIVVSPNEYLAFCRNRPRHLSSTGLQGEGDVGGSSAALSPSEWVNVPIPGPLLHLLMSGQLNAGADLAERRLVASGFVPQFRGLRTYGVSGIDCAAALLIPLRMDVTYQLYTRLMVSQETQLATSTSKGE
ncbi:type I-G CRISPR-associated protein Cas8g1/Csx17 [Alicyclobacillus acidoterrestris]|uniref:type I-G CRISPR-associated protein Cas8g1/Csx17 n=1 Tax=Alicyclobacillus acidoterrestris TaxID=1450 RepID=UPI003F5370E5